VERDWGGANPGIVAAVFGAAEGNTAKLAESGTKAGAEMFTPDANAELGPNYPGFRFNKLDSGDCAKKMAWG